MVKYQGELTSWLLESTFSLCPHGAESCLLIKSQSYWIRAGPYDFTEP